MDDNPNELRSQAAESTCIQLVYEWASCETSATYTWKKEEDYGTCPDHEWFIWQMNEMQIPGSSVMPNLVHDQIECHMTSILKQVTDWICYHHRKNFFHDEPASPLKEYLLKLIWEPDRSIDYTATAKNVLAGSNCHPMEKYRFACTYCFSEEVCNLRDMAKVAIDWCFKTEPMLVYWSKCLTDQLHTITLPTNDSIEQIMFEKALEEYNLWQPIKYFFGKLNSGARLLQCKKVISFENGKYQEEVLAHLLNECEKDKMYRKNMKGLLWNCIYHGNYEGIRQIYTELKDKWSFEDLSLIIEELAFWSIYGLYHFNVLTPILMEIWNDASIENKRRVVSTGLRSRITEKWKPFIEPVVYDFKARNQIRNPMIFIRALAQAYEPRIFLKSNFYWLVIWEPFASIVELIDEFQFSAEDVEELKKYTRQLDRMNYACLSYLKSGKLAEFSSFVSFCYADDNANRIAYQRELLMDNVDRVSFALKHIPWRMVYEFVNNVFRETDDGFASSYTTLLMRNLLERRTYTFMELIHREKANSISIVECIEAFVPHHDDLSRAKKTLISLLFEYLHKVDFFIFKENQFEKMLIWCYGSETGVAKFKEKICVSEVFYTMLKRNYVKSRYPFKPSDSMEEFLHWYYPLESERKAFKLKMIYSYGEFNIIGLLLKKRWYRRRVLEWFFENDKCKIMEFITKVYIRVGFSKR